MTKKCTRRWFVMLATVGVAAVSPAYAAGLFGPGKFEIKQVDDRFSSGPTVTYIGQNNRISKKSPVGGTYINGQGLYLEPISVRGRVDGKLVKVGFFFHNETELDTAYGSPNSLGSPRAVTFIIDGERRIAVPFLEAGTSFGEGVDYNSISRSASSSLVETGMAYLTVEDMAAVSKSKTVAIKVEGAKRAAIYDEKDISKTFLPNLVDRF